MPHQSRRVEGVETYESAGGRDEGVEAMVVFGTGRQTCVVMDCLGCCSHERE